MFCYEQLEIKLLTGSMLANIGLCQVQISLTTLCNILLEPNFLKDVALE